MGTYDHLEDADWLRVEDGEEIQWAGRPSRYTIAASLAFDAVFVVGGTALTGWLLAILDGIGMPNWLGFAPLALALYGAVSGAKTYLRWRRHLYVITDEGVYVRDGLVSREITQVPCDRVQNTSFDQSLLQRALSFGDVHVFTAGSSTEDLTLESVPDPQEVSETLTPSRTHHYERDQGPHGAV